MPRKVLWDPAVEDIVARLVPEFLRAGSVNALAARLNEALGGQDRIHPNRIHTLLSDDPRRAVNDATLKIVDSALHSLRDGVSGSLPPETAFEWRNKVLALAIEDTAPEDRVVEVARHLGVPNAIARHLLAAAGLATPLARPMNTDGRSSSNLPAPSHRPDWSFHDLAVERCRASLAVSPGRKVGLIIPTAGGKTRVALRIALNCLNEAKDNSTILWVTHRRTLHRQAREELQRMLSTATRLPPRSPELLDRIEFTMVSKLEGRLLRGAPPCLVIVDEAHHAAAPSYSMLFETPYPLAGLFLTATPNRTDGLPLGIDEVAFTITYRELFERGVVLEPIFEDFPVVNFDWDVPEVDELAEALVERAATDFTKTLVIAPTIAKVRLFHERLREALLHRPGHVLSLDDIGFVDSEANSGHISAEAFVDAFKAKPRGILVSAQMLLEGFDDPPINAVAITYPTTSLIMLMQAAGRSMRVAPGKTTAYVLQARDSALRYHYDNRWLYQEISDYLKPRLEDVFYTDRTDLENKVRKCLDQFRVAPHVRARVLGELAAVAPGDRCRLLLTGLPYDGLTVDFGSRAEWGAVLETTRNSELFRILFNEFCAVDAPSAEPSAFLAHHLPPGAVSEPERSAYYDMLVAMHCAGRELFGGQPIGDPRPYIRDGATTWLTYITFHHRAVVPMALESFLASCVNRDESIARYLENRSQWHAVARLALPLGGFLAFLLDSEQSQWLTRERQELLQRLASLQPAEQFAGVARWRVNLNVAPVPMCLMERIDTFLTVDGWATNVLALGTGDVPQETAASGR